MPGKKPISERVHEAAQEFRDTEIEYQLVAYLTRSNPSGCGLMRKEWLADILLQDIFAITDDLKVTMSKAMVLDELR